MAGIATATICLAAVNNCFLSIKKVVLHIAGRKLEGRVAAFTVDRKAVAHEAHQLAVVPALRVFYFIAYLIAKPPECKQALCGNGSGTLDRRVHHTDQRLVALAVQQRCNQAPLICGCKSKRLKSSSIFTNAPNAHQTSKCRPVPCHIPDSGG